jgi:hypothetical protein
MNIWRSNRERQGGAHLAPGRPTASLAPRAAPQPKKGTMKTTHRVELRESFDGNRLAQRILEENPKSSKHQILPPITFLPMSRFSPGFRFMK